MPILKLLERVHQSQPHKAHPFLSEEPSFKKAYLLGVALQALVDGQLDTPERDYFFKLAEAFHIDRAAAMKLLEDARSADETVVKHICDTLGKTKFSYYFIVDLQIMAQQDETVCERESRVIQLFADLLDIDEDDVAFLTDLADAVISDDAAAKARWVDNFFEAMRDHEGLEAKAFAFYTSD